MKRLVKRTTLLPLPLAVLAAVSSVAPRDAAAQPASAGSGGPQPQPAAPLDPYASPARSSGSGPGAGPADPYARPGDPAARPGEPPRPDATTAAAQPADPYARPGDPASPIPRRVGLADVPAVQGLLAVQRLDGWLLFDRDGENPIAERLVAPDGHPTRSWFYMIPARGAPIALVHSTELRSFDHLAGTKLTYQG